MKVDHFLSDLFNAIATMSVEPVIHGCIEHASPEKGASCNAVLCSKESCVRFDHTLAWNKFDNY